MPKVFSTRDDIIGVIKGSLKVKQVEIIVIGKFIHITADKTEISINTKRFSKPVVDFEYNAIESTKRQTQLRIEAFIDEVINPNHKEIIKLFGGKTIKIKRPELQGNYSWWVLISPLAFVVILVVLLKLFS